MVATHHLEGYLSGPLSSGKVTIPESSRQWWGNLSCSVSIDVISSSPFSMCLTSGRYSNGQTEVSQIGVGWSGT